MPGFILHVGAVVQCPHQSPAVIPPAGPQVLVSGMPVATLPGRIAVSPGCTFTLPGPKPQPCITVKWLLPAVRVKVLGAPVLLQAGPGPAVALCLSAEQIPNGPPIVASMQMRVLAT